MKTSKHKRRSRMKGVINYKGKAEKVHQRLHRNIRLVQK